jgi:lycopene beta-cyclase
MSPDGTSRSQGPQVQIIGDGCAALSLAARAAELPDHEITLVRPAGAPAAAEHIWGFWGGAGLEAATRLARASWASWVIATETDQVVMTSTARPYFALRRSDWTTYCRGRAAAAGVVMLDETLATGAGIEPGIEPATQPGIQQFDSRPPPVPQGMMLQHFIGLEVRAPTPVFDPQTAILMDFRVDQSHGMHFVYLLPFSPTEALVESTLFSPETLADEDYLAAIRDYLARHYGVSEFETLHRERGVIPLGQLKRRDPAIEGIGGNGGAIRPSSGYAFIFIQRQIDNAIREAGATGRLAVTSPHKGIDLAMDAVLLTVLRHWPETAPELFLRMGKALTGDEFVRFLNGEADWGLRLKVVMAMPKLPFLRGALRLVTNGRQAKHARAA